MGRWSMGYDVALTRRRKVPVIIMHMQGTPENMQKDPHYDDTVPDIRNWLEERIKAAETAGIRRSDVIVDPGIGFGKNLRHNLLRCLLEWRPSTK